jgi:hypothetical protein
MRLGLRIATAAAAVAMVAGIAACGNPNTTADLTPQADTATVTVTTTVDHPTTVTVTAQPAETPGESAADGHCTLATVDVSLGEPEGAAGSSYYPLIFTNAGFQPCTLQGFPQVAYVAGDDSHQVGDPATQDGEAGAAVTLRPGEHAVANLQEVTVQNFPENVCDPTAVTGLKVSLPGSDDAAFVPQQDRTGCAAKNLPGGQFQMSVQAIGANA